MPPLGALLGAGAVAAGLLRGHRVHGVGVVGAGGSWCLGEGVSVRDPGLVAWLGGGWGGVTGPSAGVRCWEGLGESHIDQAQG